GGAHLQGGAAPLGAALRRGRKEPYAARGGLPRILARSRDLRRSRLQLGPCSAGLLAGGGPEGGGDSRLERELRGSLQSSSARGEGTVRGGARHSSIPIAVAESRWETGVVSTPPRVASSARPGRSRAESGSAGDASQTSSRYRGSSGAGRSLVRSKGLPPSRSPWNDAPRIARRDASARASRRSVTRKGVAYTSSVEDGSRGASARMARCCGGRTRGIQGARSPATNRRASAAALHSRKASRASA